MCVRCDHCGECFAFDDVVHHDVDEVTNGIDEVCICHDCAQSIEHELPDIQPTQHAGAQS